MTIVSPPPIRLAPLGPQIQPLMSRHDIICVHTMVGYLTSTDHYFRVSNGTGYQGTESHYGIGGIWGPDLGGALNGAVWQWQDLSRTADANLAGNPRVISIETADNAARPIQKWTDRQLRSLVQLIAWLCTPAAHVRCPVGWQCRISGIPPTLVPNTESWRRGLAYHAQGARDRTVGEWWSTDPTKDCPTDARISQFKTIVIPGVQTLLREGLNMLDAQDKDWLTGSEYQYAVRQSVIAALDDATHHYLQDELQPIKDALADLQAAVSRLTPPGP